MENIYIIILIIFVTIVLSIIYSHIKIDITKYEIKNKKIDKELTIIFLSDLHNRNISKRLFNIINSIKPDIIILGGDMINDSINEDKNFFKLYNLIKNNNIYYTYGNHEEGFCFKDKYTDMLKDKNIHLLNNRISNITNNINLLGLDNEIETYLSFGKKGLNKEYISNKLGNIDDRKYNILIAHNPLEFDSFVEYNADLVLSGHVHGGLFRIPFIKGILSPDVTLFPKYDTGEYNKKNTKMIVSRGIGYSKRIPLRIFNPAEVVVIKLKKEL